MCVQKVDVGEALVVGDREGDADEMRATTLVSNL
jgi:hypothetical protein